MSTQNNKDNIVSLDETNESSLYLISSDNIKFCLPKKYALISNMINTSLSSEDFKQELDEHGNTSLDVNITGIVLSKIIDYMNLRRGEELVLFHMGCEGKEIKNAFVRRKNFETCFGDENKTFGIPKREADFIRSFYRDRKMLYEVIEAANYLHIESLLHICGIAFACIMKGVNVEKLKVIMNRTYIVPNEIDEET